MTDQPLNGRTKEGKKTTGKDMVDKSVFEVEKARADSAEERLKELENSPVLLTVLEEKELTTLLKQKELTAIAAEKSNSLIQEAADARAAAVMMSSAYNNTWSDVRKKYGLPEDVDVDWTTGEIFRKKVDPVSRVDKEIED